MSFGSCVVHIGFNPGVQSLAHIKPVSAAFPPVETCVLYLKRSPERASYTYPYIEHRWKSQRHKFYVNHMDFFCFLFLTMVHSVLKPGFIATYLYSCPVVVTQQEQT